MPKLSALVDDFDGKTIIVPGVHEYATITTTVFDAEGNKVAERRLFAGAQHFDQLPGGQKVNLKGKRKNGNEPVAEDETGDETETPTATRRGR